MMPTDKMGETERELSQDFGPRLTVWFDNLIRETESSWDRV